jgi:hypothetical protein
VPAGSSTLPTPKFRRAPHSWRCSKTSLGTRGSRRTVRLRQRMPLTDPGWLLWITAPINSLQGWPAVAGRHRSHGSRAGDLIRKARGDGYGTAESSIGADALVRVPRSHAMLPVMRRRPWTKLLHFLPTPVEKKRLAMKSSL